MELIQSGQLKPLLEETFGIQDLAKTRARLRKRTHVGKIVVTP
ncbi:NADPH:quinone reductase-like Zn-dependent oxidoreductase [Arthrobacter sp. V1I9]|nr:NADPH:quinone reductase-like Zn-dependent oxidoreductase [Arthrobacter sp. V1I9]